MTVDLRNEGTILFFSKEHIGHLPARDPQFRSAALSPADLERLEPALRRTFNNDDEHELELFREEFDVDCSTQEIADFFRSILRPALYLQERSVDPRALTAAAWKTAKNRERGLFLR